MKLKIKKTDLAIISFIILFTVFAVYLVFRPNEVTPIEIPPNYYQCGDNLVPFRANITDCLNTGILPSHTDLVNVVMNPTVEYVYILIDPEGSAGLGNAAYEIFKTLNSLYIPSGVAFTEYWENQSAVPNMTIEQATYQKPVILLLENQNSTIIKVDGPQIIVYAKTQYDLDAAVCEIAILAINDVLKC